MTFWCNMTTTFKCLIISTHMPKSPPLDQISSVHLQPVNSIPCQPLSHRHIWSSHHHSTGLSTHAWWESCEGVGHACIETTAPLFWVVMVHPSTTPAWIPLMMLPHTARVGRQMWSLTPHAFLQTTCSMHTVVAHSSESCHPPLSYRHPDAKCKCLRNGTSEHKCGTYMECHHVTALWQTHQQGSPKLLIYSGMPGWTADTDRLQTAEQTEDLRDGGKHVEQEHVM